MTDALLKFAQTQGGYVLILTIIVALLMRGLLVTKQQVDTITAAAEREYARMTSEKDEKFLLMIAAKDATIEAEQARVAFRDLQIVEREKEIMRERERADQKDQYALRLLEAGKQAAEIATAALAAKRDAEIAAAAAQSVRRRTGGN